MGAENLQQLDVRQVRPEIRLVESHVRLAQEFENWLLGGGYAPRDERGAHVPRSGLPRLELREELREVGKRLLDARRPGSLRPAIGSADVREDGRVALESDANLIDRTLRVREACRHEGGERPGSHGLAYFPLVGREEEVYAERRKIRAKGLAAGESRTGRVEGVLMERGKEPQAVVGAGRRNDHQLEAVRGALGEPEEPLHEREGKARR